MFIYADHHKEVALKIIEKPKNKFKRLNSLKFEINILKQLEHKNIFKFIRFIIEMNYKMYIITEYK